MKIINALIWATFAVSLIVFLFYAGIGHDAAVRIAWHEQFNSQFWNGILYPRWLPDSFAGFGAPTFYFYTPLVFWVGAVVNPFNVFPPEFSNALVAIIGSLLSAITISYYLKRYSSDMHTVFLLSALYAFHPYRILDVVVRGALSEHFAFVFFPLIFIAIDLATDRQKQNIRNVFLLSAIGWAGLILTNIPATVIGISGAGIYLFVKAKIGLDRFVILILGGISAACITSFYIFPIIELKESVMLDKLFRPDVGGFSNYILLDIFGSNYKFAITLLLILLLCILVLFTLVRSKMALHQQPVVRGWYAVIAFVFLLQIPYIQELLARIPGIDLVQFSWRWLTLIVPFTSIALLLSNKRSKTKGIVAAHAVINIAIILSSVFLHHFVRPPRTQEKVWYEEPEYMNIYVSADPDSAYNAFRRHEHDPFVIPEAGISASKVGINRYLITSDISEARNITLHQQYFPLWSLHEGRRTLRLAADSIGRMVATLESGEHTYELSLSSPKSSESANLISLAGIVGTVLLTVMMRPKR